MVVTAALQLQPDTIILVNANVPKNVTSADLSNQNNFFLLTALDVLAQIFSLWSDSQTSGEKGREDSAVTPAAGVGASCQTTQHTFCVSSEGQGMLKQCSNHLVFCTNAGD